MDFERMIRIEDINEEWLQNNIVKKDNKLYSFLKESLDLFIGVVSFILFLILFPLIALLIKIDSKGEIIFTQERVGKNRKKFKLYKFRTMYKDDERQISLWREKNKSVITGFGRILRRMHLDELPQAMNLLKGEVSFIGPRAEWSELSKIFEKEIPYYNYRYLVKPGIIGWAQINFPPSRSVEEAKKKFEYDLYYIKNRSLFLDTEIMIKMAKLFRW